VRTIRRRAPVESGSAHGAEGIEHQVQDGLLKLDAVTLDRPDVGRQVEVDRDLVQIRVAVRDSLDDADHIVHIDVGKARRRAVALEHGAQSANDFAGALGDLGVVEEDVQLAPAWYGWTLIVFSLPIAWMGGKLSVRKQARIKRSLDKK
jgi:hypothetical protein